MPKAAILVVDDEKNILSTLSRALRVEDFDVDVSAFAPAGRVIVSIRVYDNANNFVVRHVTLP